MFKVFDLFWISAYRASYYFKYFHPISWIFLHRLVEDLCILVLIKFMACSLKNYLTYWECTIAKYYYHIKLKQLWCFSCWVKHLKTRVKTRNSIYTWSITDSNPKWLGEIKVYIFWDRTYGPVVPKQVALTQIWALTWILSG